MNRKPIAAAKDKTLFTPGPLTTSRTVKQAMLRDLGSRDREFIAVVGDVRRRLLAVCSADAREYTTIIMQGSGTFGLEAVLASTIPPRGKLLVIVNGAYGRRMAHIASVLHIETAVVTAAEDAHPPLREIEAALESDPTISHAAIVHCETTSGILNDIRAVGALVRRLNRRYIVDAMSSFGAVPIDLADCYIDYLVSSANKCLEGVPGFSFVLARRETLSGTEGWARSVSLDLLAQWRELDASGQFRFTPPTHALLAFHQALLEFEEEGGVPARAARYRSNYETLLAGMDTMGFEPYLRAEDRGYIITSFRYPTHARFDFQKFYENLNQLGQVIYPGKVSNADCFRIGHIGRIDAADVHALLGAMRTTLAEMGVSGE